ncbi:neuropeptides capa receptor-like [Apostichopus japonicus]|uniref:neuropeptides capa receptor-like n=1 Tax=Stichopus japonicus TaxID=307972 RepID=UPI003AB58466
MRSLSKSDWTSIEEFAGFCWSVIFKMPLMSYSDADYFIYDEDQTCVNSSYDLTNRTDEYIAELLTPTYKIVIYVYVLPLVLTLGFIGNSAFIFVIIRLKRMRTITNFYLLNLAIADISYLLTGVSEKLVRTLSSPIDNDQGMYGSASCIIIYSLLDASSFASLFLVTLVTLEKFYAVCYPLKHRRVTGRERTVKLVALCWILACVFASSLIPSYCLMLYACTVWPEGELYQDFPTRLGGCWPVNDLAVDIAHGIQTLPFFLVISPNIVMYMKIIATLNNRVAASDEMKNSREKNLRMRNVVARMLVVNGTLFFILAAPFHVLSLILMAAPLSSNSSDDFYHVLDTLLPFCQLLLYMNSAINPFVYSATNARYRKAYWHAFCLERVKVANCEKDNFLVNPQNSARVNTISEAA